MYFTKQEKAILRELSTNSRATVTLLAETAECSRPTVMKIVERLSERIDLRFTLELNMERLGLGERYLVAIKFRKKPGEEVLKQLFKEDRHAQDVYLVKGGFDLLVFAVAGTAVDYIRWETRISEALSQYGPTIMPSRYVLSHFGYLPMAESFADFIGEGSGLDQIDRQMLKLLNSDSRMSYRELGSKLGITEATARYRLYSLVKSGVITRFTVSAQRPGEGYSSMIYLINYTFTKTTSSVAFANARSCYFRDDKEMPMFNTFQAIFPISGSFRSFGMVLCESKKEALEKAVRRHRRIFRNEGIRMLYGEMVKPVKGILPFRSLDIKSDYKTISWHNPAYSEA